MLEQLQLSLLLAIVAAAAWLDLRARRIPNWLTVTGLSAALLLRAAEGGPALLGGLGAAGLMLALSLPIFALGLVGGGDVKLLIAVAALLGPERLPSAVLFTAAAGGALALMEVLRRGVLLPTLLDCRDLVVAWTSLGRAGEARTLRSAGAIKFPFGVAIAVGAVTAWLY